MAWLTFFHMYMIWFLVLGSIVCCARKTSTLCNLWFIFMSLVYSEHWLFRKHKPEEHACLEARSGRTPSLLKPTGEGRAAPWTHSWQESVWRRPPSSWSQVRASASQLHQFCLCSFWNWKVSFLLQRWASSHPTVAEKSPVSLISLQLWQLLLLQLFLHLISTITGPALFSSVNLSDLRNITYDFLPCCDDSFHAVFSWLLVMFAQICFSSVNE